MGSFAPYGYDRSEEDKHKLVIDPVAAEVVKKIFKMYAEGNGYYKICEYLNNNNIPPIIPTNKIILKFKIFFIIFPS